MPIDFANHINFIGPIPHHQLPKYLEKAEVCVYPSHMEAQGLVVVEAMAMGKAVVFSNTGPGPEMIKDGLNGLLCDPYSSADIADKVIFMFEYDFEREKMSKNSRTEALTRFDMEYLTNQNIEFYKKLL